MLIRLSLSKSALLKPQVIDLKSIESIRDESPLLVKYLAGMAVTKLDVLNKYVKLVKDYAITVGNSLGLYLLLEICATSPYNATKVLADSLDWIKVCAFQVRPKRKKPKDFIF